MLEVLTKLTNLEIYFQRSNQQLVLIKFSTSWCAPCHSLEKVIQKLLQENNKIIALEINVEKFPNLAQRLMFDVKAVPALFLVWKTKIIRRSQGYMDLAKLREFIKI